MGGMRASGLLWPWKCVELAVRENLLLSQGLNGRFTDNFGIFDVEIYITQKIGIRISSKWVVCKLRGSFDVENGPDCSWGPTRCIAKVLKDVHNFFGIFDVEIRITQKMVCYSTRKSSKWGVCSLRGSFDLPNGSDKPWCHTVCIDKVLTDVHKKIWHFWRRNPDHPKNGVL